MPPHASHASSKPHGAFAATGRFRPAMMAGLVGLAVTASLGVALTVSTLSSDNLVYGGFERAFASRAGADDARQDARRASTYDGIAASEDFWLKVAAGEQANVVTAVAVGREITVTNADGQRRLTVTNVRDVTQAATHISTRDGATRVLFLTCRETDAGALREIRLIMDEDGIQPTAPLSVPAAKGVPTT